MATEQTAAGNGTAPETAEASEVVLEARHLTRHYAVRLRGRTALARGARPVVRAVDDVSLTLARRKIVAVVGESGSGKSTLARLLAQLERPTGGQILLNGEQVGGRTARALRPFRRQVQMIFQDPFASLNSVHRIGYHLERPLQIHKLVSGSTQARAEAERLLGRVSLTPAAQYLDRFPHELSGGQRQRAAIARALAVRPSVLLADEPVSMLDVSIRMGVLNLLAGLGRDEHLAVLYITHDIGSARYFADSVQVMYAGQLIEGGTADQVTQEAAHPYTRLLIDSAPDPERPARAGGSAGSAPAGPARAQLARAQPTRTGTGCRFAGRCPRAMDICATEAPPQFQLGGGHWARCWLHEPTAAAPPGAAVPA
jgi:peptide/nickel transport system ATP-binding protein